MALALILVGAGMASLAVASADRNTYIKSNAMLLKSLCMTLNVFGVAVLGSLSSMLYRVF